MPIKQERLAQSSSHPRLCERFARAADMPDDDDAPHLGPSPSEFTIEGRKPAQVIHFHATRLRAGLWICLCVTARQAIDVQSRPIGTIVGYTDSVFAALSNSTSCPGTPNRRGGNSTTSRVIPMHVHKSSPSASFLRLSSPTEKRRRMRVLELAFSQRRRVRCVGHASA